jgi:glycosyltransferase involved in cell wall biosynthesis
MVTAVIITHNEERNIGRCLASLAGIVEEVIVVDGHSTDRTAEICAAQGARLVIQDWLGYAATKNLGNAMASHPYILSLDADEALSSELQDSILAVKKNLNGAYSFNRLAFYCGKPIRHGGWYPDTKVRLFPKDRARWEGAHVHEVLHVDLGVNVHHMKGDLLHYTYYSVAEHRERARHYAKLAAERLQTKGKLELLVKAVLSPVWRFFQMYVLRLGFLDGWRGWRIAGITAKEVWWKYWWAIRRIQPIE